MPIYEYLCNSCGYEFERLQKISDTPINVCPDCNKSTVKKLISASKFRLSGNGWYETDFKNNKETKRNLVSSGVNSSADGAANVSGSNSNSVSDVAS